MLVLPRATKAETDVVGWISPQQGPRSAEESLRWL